MYKSIARRIGLYYFQPLLIWRDSPVISRGGTAIIQTLRASTRADDDLLPTHTYATEGARPLQRNCPIRSATHCLLQMKGTTIFFGLCDFLLKSSRDIPEQH
jgi:hypothetical protein